MKRSQAIQLSIVTSVAAALMAQADDLPKRPCDDPNRRVVDQLSCEPSHTGHSLWFGRRRVKTKGTVRGGIGKSGEAKANAHAGG